MDLAVIAPAKRDGELVADLATRGPALGELQVIGVRRPSAANQARMLGDRLDVLAVADPARLR